MLYNLHQVSGIYSVIISSVYIVLNLNIIFQWYTNADLKTYQYLHLHMKITFRRFHIETPFTFWDRRTWYMWKVCLQTFRNNIIRWKLACFLRNLQTLRANNSVIFRFKIVKFSGYCFYMNTNVWGDFQICISMPLRVVQACSIIFSTTSNIDGLQEGREREGVEKLAAKYC